MASSGKRPHNVHLLLRTENLRASFHHHAIASKSIGEARHAVAKASCVLQPLTLKASSEFSPSLQPHQEYWRCMDSSDKSSGIDVSIKSSPFAIISKSIGNARPEVATPTQCSPAFEN
mmetsp:Transcript_155443/g.275726  ORF Transcript_155443/g.275726 Transcript_155443/m.275726 type:complete len:118 (+) Transcript_155443:26-379(+)